MTKTVPILVFILSIFGWFDLDNIQVFEAGEFVERFIDVDGDGQKERLEALSTPVDTSSSSIRVFKIFVNVTDSVYDSIYQDTIWGELGWFTVQTGPFQFDDSLTRNVALIRTGCMGTGWREHGYFIYSNPDSTNLTVVYKGNQGLYDSDSNGIPDMLITHYRAENVGVGGAMSPWLSYFSIPSIQTSQEVDRTFQVLALDSVYRSRWIEDLNLVYDALNQPEMDGMATPERLLGLELLIFLLEQNADPDSCASVYNDFFN